LKPSADVENEAKKWLHLLKIRKKRNQKWKQKMASGIHRQAAQSLLNSLCFLIATRQSHARGVHKRCRRHCWQAIVPSDKAASLKYFEQKNSDQEKIESTLQ